MYTAKYRLRRQVRKYGQLITTPSYTTVNSSHDFMVWRVDWLPRSNRSAIAQTNAAVRSFDHQIVINISSLPVPAFRKLTLLTLKSDRRSHHNVKQTAKMRSAVPATAHTPNVLMRYHKLRINSCSCWQDNFGICASADKIDVLSPLKNATSKQTNCQKCLGLFYFNTDLIVETSV